MPYEEFELEDLFPIHEMDNFIPLKIYGPGTAPRFQSGIIRSLKISYRTANKIQRQDRWWDLVKYPRHPRDMGIMVERQQQPPEDIFEFAQQLRALQAGHFFAAARSRME